MAAYVALLRAVNVGGTGKLAMRDLSAICESCRFTDVTTYIQSGNVVFKSARREEGVKKVLTQALTEHMGKAHGVIVRTAPELRKTLAALPFPEAAPNRVHVMFLDTPVTAGNLKEVVAPGGEQVRALGRDVFIHFPDGAGRSKLKLPFAKNGTMRNLNTVRKLLELLEALEG